MLDFSFTPAQEEYRAALRKIALEELAPRYQSGDSHQVYPGEQIRRILAFAAEFWAGREAEHDLITVGITAEEVARGDFNAVLPSLGPGYTRMFLGAASDQLLGRWLPGLASGEHQPEVDQLVVLVETVIQLDLVSQGGGADLDQAVILFAQATHLRQQGLRLNNPEGLGFGHGRFFSM